MNFINEALGKDKDQSQAHQSGGEGGLMGKLNNAMGGGAAGEKKEGMVVVRVQLLYLTLILSRRFGQG